MLGKLLHCEGCCDRLCKRNKTIYLIFDIGILIIYCILNIIDYLYRVCVRVYRIELFQSLGIWLFVKVAFVREIQKGLNFYTYIWCSCKSVCLRLYVYAFLCLYTCLVYTYASLCICLSAGLYAHQSVRLHVCRSARLHVCTSVRLHICTSARIYDSTFFFRNVTSLIIDLHLAEQETCNKIRN